MTKAPGSDAAHLRRAVAFLTRHARRICVLSTLLTPIAAEPGTVAENLTGPDDERPNILFIVADDLGPECLGSYGGTSYETPHLDELARGGIRFTNCFSTPKCSPSRATLLTGRYTFRTTAEWGRLPPSEKTFGNLLEESGYATAMAGKWQMALLRDDPHHLHNTGFTESCAWAWHEGPRYWKPWIYVNGVLRKDFDEQYGPDIYCDSLIRFIQEHSREPFLAYYPMALPHFPEAGEPVGPNGRRETYAEMVSILDARVGRLLSEIERLGLRRKTLILFTGDNGSPQRVRSKLGTVSIKGGKGDLTDAGTRVPLIANWPGTIPAGVVSPDLVDFSDFLPTLVELAGASLPPGVDIDGKSFAARLRGQESAPREWVYTEFGPPGSPQDWHGWVRDSRWKLYDDGELFDMDRDPSETTPLAAEEDDEAAATARARLRAVHDALRHGRGGGRPRR
jgi:arylsulfatase A